MSSSHEPAAYAAEIGDAPEIDLHDSSPDQAKHAVDAFLHQAFMRGEPAVRIIHGRGSGAMRREIHALLEDHPLVDYFRDAIDPGALGGMTVVVVQRK
jgi:DNA mismatch repair protein MutS2